MQTVGAFRLCENHDRLRTRVLYFPKIMMTGGAFADAQQANWRITLKIFRVLVVAGQVKQSV